MSNDSPTPLLRVLSLGAGVQSTTLALMAAHGEITPMPDCAIFADTQSEPEAVYEHLRWLVSPNVLPFPVHIVTAGSLYDQIIGTPEGRNRNDGRPPMYIRNQDGSQGILKRQCTEDFKIIPIEREIRRLLGLRKGQHWPKEPVVEQWLGISLDEIIRCKPSRRPAIERRFPLIEKGMRRWDCFRWMEDRSYPRPPSSACVFCPFNSNPTWRAMRDEDGSDWSRAVTIDHAVRSRPYRGLVGEGYLHRSLVPLDQVDLRTGAERGQPDLFGNECEGMCGV